MDDRFFVAYRNFEITDAGRHIRDISVANLQDGVSASEVLVSDEHWYLNACPSSGPSVASDGETIFVSWMDGRKNVEEGSVDRSDIWLAASSDGGTTFSKNRRVNRDVGYNNRPSVAVDEQGELHVVWSARVEGESAVLYSRSEDGGRTFADPLILVGGGDEYGRLFPDYASLAAGTGGTLYMAWTDRLGSHLAVWRDG
jgi:hypothetical protein